MGTVSFREFCILLMEQADNIIAAFTKRMCMMRMGKLREKTSKDIWTCNIFVSFGQTSFVAPLYQPILFHDCDGRLCAPVCILHLATGLWLSTTFLPEIAYL